MTTINWLITFFIVVGLVLIGGGDLLEHAPDGTDHLKVLTGLVIRDIGISLLVAGLIGIFDTFLKNHLFHELDKRAGIDNSIVSAGVSGVHMQVSDMDWAKLFRNCTEFDLVAFRARTWRQTHRDKIKAILKHRRGKVRIFLPNPGNPVLMQELADRFSQPDAKRTAEDVWEAVKEYRSWIPSGKSHGTLEIYFFDRALTYTLYRFNNEIVVTLYSFSPGRNELPVFQCMRGKAHDVFVRDLEGLRKISTSAP